MLASRSQLPRMSESWLKWWSKANWVVVASWPAVRPCCTQRLLPSSRRLPAQGESLPGQRAAGVQQRAPLLAAFPETVVAGVVVKAQKDGQRETKQAEGRGAERHFVGGQLHMGRHHGPGQRPQRPQPRQNLGQHRAVPGEKQAKPIVLLTNNYLLPYGCGRWMALRADGAGLCPVPAFRRPLACSR